MNRRSFFGVVVAGASALVLPRKQPQVREVTVHPIVKITYPEPEHADEIRRKFAEIVQHFNTHDRRAQYLCQDEDMKRAFEAVPGVLSVERVRVA